MAGFGWGEAMNVFFRSKSLRLISNTLGFVFCAWIPVSVKIVVAFSYAALADVDEVFAWPVGSTKLRRYHPSFKFYYSSVPGALPLPPRTPDGAFQEFRRQSPHVVRRGLHTVCGIANYEHFSTKNGVTLFPTSRS